jgi:60 kDa SS-A/Ro ribonucleoprotein
MIYAKLFNRKSTPQTQPIPGAGQVPNHAGGYGWKLDPWGVLDRFLILGSEAGTFYVAPQKLTADNADNLLQCLVLDGQRTVKRIVEISQSGRAPKNDPAIFALAFAASFGDDKTRAAALAALPDVCRTGTHLFAFAAACDGMRGWGRGLRKAVGRWYNGKDLRSLEYQAVKYQQREGWSHRDLLRLAHPVPLTEQHKVLYKWVVDGEVTGELPLVEAMNRLAGVSAKEAARIVREQNLPREAVPTELLKEPVVWEALLEAMPMTAMVRNLATMTRVGLLTAGSDAAKKVVKELHNEARLRQARVHPMALLIALRTYASGRGLRGSGQWQPVTKVVEELDSAFYKAFEFVQPTNRRYLLGVDVSGSMSSFGVAGSPLTACEAATAMAMVTVGTEDFVVPMAFADTFKPLGISRRMRLDAAMREGQRMNFGGTDCALPMLYALERRLAVDVFVVYTDNETWYGKVHPAQAVQQYRDKMGIDAKLIVVGITSTGFSTADPRDAGMLDVVGFDASVPNVMAEFAKG